MEMTSLQQKYFNEYNEIIKAIEDNANNAKALKQIIRKDAYYISPETQFIRLDALEEKDYPSGIDRNSIYVCFRIDMDEKSVQIHSAGSVWISEADKERYEGDRYMAMHPMLAITKRNGGKVMRKQRYKDSTDLAKKVIKAYNDIMAQVLDYTNYIYPYKNGVKSLKYESVFSHK